MNGPAGGSAAALRAPAGAAGPADAPAPATDGPVLAVLEDCAAGARLIECSAALARAFGRELAVVQVQSTLALQVAALPQTRALAYAGAAWAPFEPEDVERGWRAQAARLQALAAPIALRHALRWSLRSVRGEPGAVARSLLQETDLLVLGTTAPAGPIGPIGPVRARPSGRAAAARPRLADGAAPARSLARHPGRPAVLAVLDDGSDAARRAAKVAARLATALPGAWQVRMLAASDEAALAAALRHAAAPDALVLPRHWATPARWTRLAQLGCPVLLVG